ncbi:MAG: PAS domain-containing protein, partial [Pseudomonadota bacterium]
MLALLGILSMAGVFFLFALAIGLVEFSSNRKQDDIGGAFLNSHLDGICIANEENTIVYANRAYGDIIGMRDVIDLQTPENVLSKHDDAANALYRLANSAQKSVDADEEFRLPTSLNGHDSQPHWYRASVHSMVGPALDTLQVWRITDVSNDRDTQEQYFLELQKAIDHLDRSPVGFFSSNADGRVQYLNATMAEWLGIDLSSFSPGGMTIEDLLSSEGLQLLNAVQAEPGTSRTAIIDLDLAKPNGESLPVQLIHRVQTHSDGQAGQMRTIAINRAEGDAASHDLR